MYMYETHVSNFKYNQHTSSNKSQHSIRQPLLGMTLISVHLKEESAQKRVREKEKEWQGPTLSVRVKEKDSRGV